MNNEIKCPKCGSTQLTANKKGFSGKKAVVGGLLTGGVGLLAGTIGSNKVKITCLACGNVFNPGEGKVVNIPDVLQNSTLHNKNNLKLNILVRSTFTDENIIEVAKKKGKLAAVKFCKKAYNIDLSEANLLVDKLTAGLTLPKNKTNKTGCIVILSIIGFILLIIGISNINNDSTNDDKSAITHSQAFYDSIIKSDTKTKTKADSIAEVKYSKTKAGKINKKHPEWSKEDCELIADKKIWIGMTLDMLKYERGNPNSANQSNYGSGTQWQWCWENYTPSCFYGGEEGIVTSYN